MDVKADAFRLWLAPRRVDHAPSVLERNGAYNIIAPSGFFKLLLVSPTAARDMLAHELAHIRQNDTNLFVLVMTFSKVARNFLPWVIAMALLQVLVTAARGPGEADERLSSAVAAVGQLPL
jgi:hypothetical protein